jgi:hypothetical protein
MNKVLPVFMMLLFAACAGEPSIDQSPDAELSFDGLSPIRNSVFQRAWIDPEIDLSQYDKILLGETDFEFRTVRETQSRTAIRNSSVREFYISEEGRAKLIETVTSIFREELEASQSFTLTDQPDPDTLILVGGLSDIVSRVPPALTGAGMVYVESLGEATLVFELRDSLSGETLYRAADRKRIERQDRPIQVSSATAWEEVRRWARSWAVKVRDGLDAIHE